MEKILEIADLIRRTVQVIVASPEAVTLEISEGGTLRLRVAPPDLGKVIGANGRTARALRQLLSSMAAAAEIQMRLEIVDDQVI